MSQLIEPTSTASMEGAVLPEQHVEACVISEVIDDSEQHVFGDLDDQSEYFKCTAMSHAVRFRSLSRFEGSCRKCSRDDVFLEYIEVSDVGLRADKGKVTSVVLYLRKGGILSFTLRAPSAMPPHEEDCCKWATAVLTGVLSAQSEIVGMRVQEVAAKAISSTRLYVKQETIHSPWSLALTGLGAALVATILYFQV
jgi:hypothetical protein